MKKQNSITMNDLKFLAKPIGFAALSLLVVAVVFLVGVGQVKAINNKVKTSKRLQTILSGNVTVLQWVDTEIGSQQQNFIEVALPTSNTPIYFISQIKSLAGANGLFISNIRTGIGSDQGGGVLKAGVSFDVEGSVDAIALFVNGLMKVLPIGNLNKVKTVISGGTARSSLTIDVYSSKLPEKIPSLTSPITSLTAEEKNTLLELVNYTLPNFIKPQAQTPIQRDNPFD